MHLLETDQRHFAGTPSPPPLLCELCPSKNSPSRAMLTPSAGPSANAAADSRHKATSSVFSSGCGCRSSANHTPRSRRISGSRTTLPRPPSALRRGKPRVGVYSTQSRRYAARQRAPRPRLDPSRTTKDRWPAPEPQPSDQRFQADDWLLRVAPNRKMTSSHRMAPFFHYPQTGFPLLALVGAGAGDLSSSPVSSRRPS